MIYLTKWCMVCSQMNVISCSLGKLSNNAFHGFSSVECATSIMLPLTRHKVFFSFQILELNQGINMYNIIIHYNI